MTHVPNVLSEAGGHGDDKIDMHESCVEGVAGFGSVTILNLTYLLSIFHSMVRTGSPSFQFNMLIVLTTSSAVTTL